jgi:hypothetical protein
MYDSLYSGQGISEEDPLFRPVPEPSSTPTSFDNDGGGPIDDNVADDGDAE